LNSLNLNILNRATLSKKSRDAVILTEAVVVVCPNPRCQREIGEPILLTILSVTPPKQYEACPYCFAKLEQEAPIEQEAVTEPTIVQEKTIETDEEAETAVNLSVNTVLEKVMDSGPSFFKKFKALIPSTSGLKKEKKEKTKEPQAEPVVKEEKAPKEEPKTEPIVKKEDPKEAFQTDSSGEEETAKEEPKIEPSAKKESGSSGCPETFGYLANRPKNVPIPQGCLICPKMVDCVLSPREY
jgi:hypothetical protein